MTRDEESAYDRKFRKVMAEFEAGTLRSSSGEPVTSRKQAQAIAASEAEQATGDDNRGSD